MFIDLIFSSPEKSLRLNPVHGFAQNSDLIMGMLMQITGQNLTRNQVAMAKKVGMDSSAESEPTVLSLSEAWKACPDLREFALAVRSAMLPGVNPFQPSCMAM